MHEFAPPESTPAAIPTLMALAVMARGRDVDRLRCSGLKP